MRRDRTWSLIGALSAASACSPETPEPFWTGTYLAYSSTTEIDVCEGSWVLQDRYVELLSELLGVTPPRPVRFTFIDRYEREKFCDDDSLLGCARDDEVYSIYAVQLHELAHSVATPAGLGGPLAFQEGFAEVFSDGQFSVAERLPIADVVQDFAGDGGSYYTAGLFVRFLIEEYGLEKLLAFLRNTDRDDGVETYAAVFEETYGAPLTDALAAFEAYPSCTMWNNRIALLECMAPPLPWAGDAWTASSALACDDPEVLGPVPDGEKMLVWSTRTLDIESNGQYVARTTGEVAGAAGARITRCASCWDSVDAQINVGQERTLNLTAGRYYVTLIKEPLEPGTLDFLLTRTP